MRCWFVCAVLLFLVNFVFTSSDEVKRYNKFVPFPRVGRSFNKRNEAKAGMWFGPRLGRVHKRNTGLNEVFPPLLVFINDPPSMEDSYYNGKINEQSDEIYSK